MKTKKEILKMNTKQLIEYQSSSDLKDKGKIFDSFDCSDCHNCTYLIDCSECSWCSNCYHCVGCYNSLSCDSCTDCFECFNCVGCLKCSKCHNALFCKNLRFEERDPNRYWICNVEVTKEEFEKKKQELKS